MSKPAYIPATPLPKPRKVGLAPLVCNEPRILILGSLPGDESLRRQEYYGKIEWTEENTDGRES